MMTMSPVFVWFLSAVILAIADLLLATYYLLVLALACLVAAVFALFTDSLAIEAVVFAVIAVTGCLLLVNGRRKKALRHAAEVKTLDEADRLQSADVGQLVEVSQWSATRSTRVNYRGAQWDAVAQEGAPLEPGVWCIVNVIGNKLIVVPEPKN